MTGELPQAGNSTAGVDPSMDAIVRLRAVKKQYGSVTVLDGIDVAIYPGEMVVVMGRSGSGKSTILRVMAGLTEPDSGTVDIDGTRVIEGAVRRPEWSSLRRRIGMIFQQYTLWPHMDVLENLALAPRRIFHEPDDVIERRAAAVLDEVGMARHLRSRPTQLSGGERQRVAIARALMMRPQLLLCDEITSALDPPVAHEVLGVLTKLRDNDGIACVIVTHDMAFAMKAAQRLLFVERGQIVDQGPPEEAFKGSASEGLDEFIKATLWR